MLKASLETSDFYEKGTKLLLLVLSLCLLSLVAATIASFTFGGDVYISRTLLFGSSALTVGLFLVAGGYFRTVSYFLCGVVLAVGWHSIIFSTRTISSPPLSIFILIFPLALLVLSKLESLIIILSMYLSVVLLYLLEINEFMGAPPQTEFDDLLAILAIFTLMGLAYYFTLQWGMMRKEHALKKVESQYKRLYDNIPIGLYQTTPQGYQIRANQALWELEGYSSAEESLEDSFDIAKEWYVKKNRRAEFIHEVEKNGSAINFESQIYHRKTGEKIWISESAYPVYDKKGTLLFYEGSVQDITQRKMAEAKMRKRAAELKQLSNSYMTVANTAKDIIISCKLDGEIFFINQAAQAILGYSPDELIGQRVGTLVEPEKLPEFQQNVEKALQRSADDKGNSSFQVVGVRKNGEQALVELTMATWVNTNQETVITAVVRDVTHREKTAEFLNQMQRLDSLGLLAGGIAHDFNNLLVAILGQTSVALHKLPDDSSARDNLKKAKAAGLQAADLCRQLLAYSGKGHFEIHPINLNELINENISLHKIVISELVELETNLDAHLPLIMGDRSQIQQVIMNLLLNASDAIGDQVGKITLSTEFRMVGKKDSLLWTRSGRPLKPGTYAVLHVKDSGLGMDRETVERIFEPFFTTKDEGNGLGLSAVQGIIRGHEGSMLVQSDLRLGTTFSIYFPVESPDEPPYRLAGNGSQKLIKNSSKLGGLQTPPDINQSKQQILIVDDQEDVRRTFCDMLKIFGYQVFEAKDGMTAIKEFEMHHSEIDLVLLDYNMPTMNGKQVLKRLRAINPELPIIMCSGYADGVLPRQDEYQKSVGFLTKPFSPTELQQMVKKHIG